MNETLYLSAGLLIALIFTVYTLLISLPILFLAGKQYTQALSWLKQYFRVDVGLYSPFDLVYLYIKTNRGDEVNEMYRKYQRKGSVASDHFVAAWVAAHQGDWKTAAAAHTELRKYTIMNDVNLKKLGQAIEKMDARQIDDMYLIDMNGRATIHPSVLRVIAAVLASTLAVAAVAFLSGWVVTHLLYIA